MPLGATVFGDPTAENEEMAMTEAIRVTSSCIVMLALAAGGVACGGAGAEEGAERAAIRWAEAWTDEDKKRLCELTVLGVNGRPTDGPGCENHWVRVFDERERLMAEEGRGDWRLPSPDVTRSRVSEDSARAEVEVTGSNGTVLVLDMSRKGGSWLVEVFDSAWGHNGP